MHTYNTRSQKTFSPTVDEELAFIRTMKHALESAEDVSDRRVKMEIATQMFNEIVNKIEFVHHFPGFRSVLQDKVNEFSRSHRYGRFNDIDRIVHKQFTTSLYQLQRLL
jgi:hypothetical protein